MCRTLTIQQAQGRQMLFEDDKPVSPVVYALSDFPGARSNTAYAQRNIKNFADAGISIVSADTDLRLGWYKTSAFDSEPLLSEILGVTDANPNAKVLLRLHMNPPYWWLRDYPKETVIYRTEEGDLPGVDDGEQERLIRNDGAQHLRASTASVRWKEDACQCLKKFLQDVKNSGVVQNLAGIQVAYGINGEWHQWGADVSAPMKNYFVSYLKEKYQKEENLAKKWNQPGVTFQTAEFHPESFGKTDDGSFRDPQKSQYMIDSQECMQRSLAEAIIIFCKVIKEEIPGMLCGAFYGYYMNMVSQNKPIKGHLCPEVLAKSGVVDFLCGPFAYMENRKAYGVPMQRALLESMHRKGFLWLTEMDQDPFGTEKYVGGDVERKEETISVLRRNTLQPLLAGHGFWYYDHRIIPSLLSPDCQNSTAASIYRKNGWWDTPWLMEEIAKLKKFADQLLERNYTSVADVLLVYDNDSLYYRSVNDQEYDMYETLIRHGIVFDCIYAEDFAKCKIEQYKCVIFVNCHKVSTTLQKQLQEISQKRLVICLNGCGYCDGDTLSVENISSAVGMKVTKEEATSLKLAKDGEVISLAEDLKPFFAIEDALAKPLAYYNTGNVAAAIKENRVYLQTPYLPKALAAELLARAGVHRWCDSGEPVLAGYGYMMIHCQRQGSRQLFFPNGKTVALETTGYESAVFDVETGERVL